MNKEYISILLKKYLEGTCTISEKAVVDSWIDILDVEQNWLEISDEKLDIVEIKIWKKLKVSIENAEKIGNRENEKTGLKRKLISMKYLTRIAAVFLIIIGGYLVLNYTTQIKTANAFDDTLSGLLKKGWVKYENNTAKEEALNLEDGTIIKLSPTAVIYYPVHFEGVKREVRLKGTAFFMVAPNKKLPFYVVSKSIITRVLGTSFWVKDDGIMSRSQVEVKTGAVSVFANSNLDKVEKSDAKGVLLKPNEKTLFNVTTEEFSTKIVDNPQPIITDSVDNVITGTYNEEKFHCTETKLSEIVDALEKEYGIIIMLENAELRNMEFTGNISDFSYFDKIKILCKALKLNYEVKENRILIKK